MRGCKYKNTFPKSKFKYGGSLEDEVNEDGLRLEYALEDIKILDESLSGAMSITDTKHGLLDLSYNKETGIYQIYNQGNKLYEGDRKGAIEFVADSYVIEYENGGGVEEEGVNLFEDYENIPENVQEILDEHQQAFEDGDYRGLEQAHKELEAIGYTFDYYLDGQAYDLRPIGTKGKVELASEKFDNKNNTPFENGGVFSEEIITPKGRKFIYTKRNNIHHYIWKNIPEEYLGVVGKGGASKTKLDDEALDNIADQITQNYFEFKDGKYSNGGGVDKAKVGDLVKVKTGANKGIEGKIHSIEDDFTNITIKTISGHTLYGFKLSDLEVFEEGGSIDSVRRFTEGDFNKLMDDKGFRATWSGYVWEIYPEGGGRVLGKFNPKKNTLFVTGKKDLTNELVKYLQQNSYVSSEEYYKLEKGGSVNEFEGVLNKIKPILDKKKITIGDLLSEHTFVSGNKYWRIAYAIVDGNKFKVGDSVLWDSDDYGTKYKGIIDWMMVGDDGSVEVALKDEEERRGNKWIKSGLGRLGIEDITHFEKGGSVKSKYWIKKALSGNKYKGALRKKAMKEGLLRNDNEKLSMTDLNKLQKMGGKTAKRAYFAKTLRSFDNDGDVSPNESDTFVVILKDFGFKEKRSSYGVRHFYNKEKDSYASYDAKLRQISVDDDNLRFSVRDLINYLESKGFESGINVGQIKDILKLKDGGNISYQNALMVINDNKQIKHHTEELNKVVNKDTEVPAWVVSKVHRSASDLSDATHYLDGVNSEFGNGGLVDENSKIKDWYIKEYSSDDLGKELNNDSTFKDLLNAILNGNDVYSVLGVGDSVVRERAFAKLSKINNKEPQWAYNSWLMYSNGGIALPYSFASEGISEDRFKERQKAFVGYLGDVISIQTAETFLGRKINSWKDDVITIGDTMYKKVYLRPEYKRMTMTELSN